MHNATAALPHPRAARGRSVSTSLAVRPKPLGSIETVGIDFQPSGINELEGGGPLYSDLEPDRRVTRHNGAVAAIRLSAAHGALLP
jgi:hypothetical protein